MAKLDRLTWWRWLPVPWRRWRLLAVVDAADEVPDKLPTRSAVLVGNLDYPKWIAFDCPCVDHQPAYQP